MSPKENPEMPDHISAILSPINIDKAKIVLKALGKLNIALTGYIESIGRSEVDQIMATVQGIIADTDLAVLFEWIGFDAKYENEQWKFGPNVKKDQTSGGGASMDNQNKIFEIKQYFLSKGLRIEL